MPLYDNPKLVRQALRLARKRYTRRQIAVEIGVGVKTVRKMLDPGFAATERERLRAVDAARSPRWANDPVYRAYQIEYAKSPDRLAQVRNYMRERRSNAD